MWNPVEIYRKRQKRKENLRRLVVSGDPRNMALARHIHMAVNERVGDFDEWAAEQISAHKRETELRECPRLIPPSDPVQIDTGDVAVFFHHAVRFKPVYSWLFGDLVGWKREPAGMITWHSGGYTLGAATPFLNPFPKSEEAIRERNEFINSFVNG